MGVSPKFFCELDTMVMFNWHDFQYERGLTYIRHSSSESKVCYINIMIEVLISLEPDPCILLY